MPTLKISTHQSRILYLDWIGFLYQLGHSVREQDRICSKFWLVSVLIGSEFGPNLGSFLYAPGSELCEHMPPPDEVLPETTDAEFCVRPAVDPKEGRIEG